ncbi:MAG: DUF1343 domain-containing protein [Bacteroidales bacterium]|jgi:uncharacterized protein YbbC (DUF1343 family)|nr:DUF1343 domain-containing protein [Bacteroidales bacterium]
MKISFFLFLLLVFSFVCRSQSQEVVFIDIDDSQIQLGAARTQEYFPLLEGKNIALCVNHTSVVKNVHLLDVLMSAGMNVVKVFSPEHGLNGNEEAGKSIQDATDPKTKIPIISLYGNNKKPTKEQLKEIDLIIFDMQDVGARFFTYISTLHYVMEAAAENSIKVIVLDRPNPNGYWIDGPVLDTAYRSFVGMHPVPIAYGMTIGEYARMINGEGWLKGRKKCDLTVIQIFGYVHILRYQLPINPSPNLSSMAAIYLYPSMCLFEGTVMSIGRGTDKPFCIYGHPDFPIGNVYFTPKNITGIATNPPCLGKECRGFDVTDLSLIFMKDNNFINLNLLIEAYHHYPDKTKFFSAFFDKLAGNKSLREQIMAGKTADEIRYSWQKDLIKFKQVRKKYLLYPDFE